MADIKEPNWTALMPDSQDEDMSKWRDVASSYWSEIVAELTAAETLSKGNAHQIRRLVIAYVRFDRACADVFARSGPVTLSPNGQEMLRQIHVEMRQADADATTAEMELGIPPRRRGAVTKAAKPKKQSGKADLYLIQAKKA